MKLAEQEIKDIIKAFIGDNYVENGDCVLGYMTMAGVRRWVTELYMPDDGTANVQVTDPAFDDEALTAEIVAGYIISRMEMAVPQYYVSIESKCIERWRASVTFSFK